MAVYIPEVTDTEENIVNAMALGVAREKVIEPILGSEFLLKEDLEMVVNYLKFVAHSENEPSELNEEKPLTYKALKFILASLHIEPRLRKSTKINDKYLIIKDPEAKIATVYYAAFSEKTKMTTVGTAVQMDQIDDPNKLIPDILDDREKKDDWKIQLNVVIPKEHSQMAQLIDMIPSQPDSQITVRSKVLPFGMPTIKNIQKKCWGCRSEVKAIIGEKKEKLPSTEEIAAKLKNYFVDQGEQASHGAIADLVKGNEERIAKYIIETAKIYSQKDLSEAKGYLFEALVSILLETEEFKQRIKNEIGDQNLQIDSESTAKAARAYQLHMQSEGQNHGDMLFLERNVGQDVGIANLKIGALLECKIATSNGFPGEHVAQMKKSAHKLIKFISWINKIPFDPTPEKSAERLNLGGKISWLDVKNLPLIMVKLAAETEEGSLNEQAVRIDGYNFHIMRTPITIKGISDLWEAIKNPPSGGEKKI